MLVPREVPQFGTMTYLPPGRSSITLDADGPAHAVLLGGVPFPEPVLMWWNFVARTHEEIVRAQADWNMGRGFDPVRDYPGERLDAPALPTVRFTARPSAESFG